MRTWATAPSASDMTSANVWKTLRNPIQLLPAAAHCVDGRWVVVSHGACKYEREEQLRRKRKPCSSSQSFGLVTKPVGGLNIAAHRREVRLRCRRERQFGPRSRVILHLARRNGAAMRLVEPPLEELHKRDAATTPRLDPCRTGLPRLRSTRPERGLGPLKRKTAK